MFLLHLIEILEFEFSLLKSLSEWEEGRYLDLELTAESDGLGADDLLFTLAVDVVDEFVPNVGTGFDLEVFELLLVVSL